MARPRKERPAPSSPSSEAPSPSEPKQALAAGAHVRLRLAAHARFDGCQEWYPALVTRVHGEGTLIDCELEPDEALQARDISPAQKYVPNVSKLPEDYTGPAWTE